MNDQKDSGQKLTKIQLYFFFIGAILMVAYTSFNYGNIDTLLGIIGGSIIISNILTKRLTSKIEEKKEDITITRGLMGLVVGGLVAGLFIAPVELVFRYIRNEEVTTGIFFLFILVSIVTGAAVGFLINHISGSEIDFEK